METNPFGRVRDPAHALAAWLQGALDLHSLFSDCYCNEPAGPNHAFLPAYRFGGLRM